MKMLKTIISILTSMQLMFMQVVIPIAVTQSLFGTYAAYAEDGGSDSQQQEGEEGFGNTVSNAAGSVGNGLKKVFPGMKDGDAADMLNFILIMVVGFIAASLFMCEKKSADIYIAAAGGAIYIIGELMQLFKSDDKFKAEAIEYDTNANGAANLSNEQTEAFTKQQAGLQEAKEAALNKAKMQKAAGAVWYTAAVVAGAFELMNSTNLMGCTANVKALTATYTSGLPYTAAQLAKLEGTCAPALLKSAEYKAGEAVVKPSALELTNCSATATINTACAGTGAVQCGTFGSMLLNACASCGGILLTAKNQMPLDEYYAYSIEKYNDYKNPNMCKRPQSSLDESNVFYDVALNAAEKISDILFPKAHANNLMKLFGGLGAGIAIVLVMKKALDISIENMMGSPLRRAIAYTVLGTLAMMTAKKNEEVAKKMEERSRKIDAILKRFAAFQRTNAAINNAFNRGQDLTNVPLRVGTPIGTSEEPFPCMNTSKSGKCLSTKSAINRELQKSNLNLPEGLTSMASLAGSTADGVAGKTNLSAGTVDGLNTLASNASRAAANNRAMQDKLNKIRKKSGQKPINFKKEGNKFLSGLQGSLLKALDKKGISGSKALSAVSPGIAPSDLSGNVKDEIKKEVAKQSAEATPTGSKTASKGGGFQFNLDKPAGEELNIADGEGIDAEAELDGLEEGELEVDDIVQDENVSIFKVISVRYFKSGYPRVLRRKEDIEPKADSK